MPTRRKIRARKPAAEGAEATRQHLTALLRELRAAQSVIIVSVEALREENSCTGMHVAALLQRAASNKLDIEIERTARYLISIGGQDNVFDNAGVIE